MNMPTTFKTQLQDEGYITHIGNIAGAPISGDLKIVPLRQTRHLHQKDLITSVRFRADLPKNHSQTQKGRQNRKTKKYAPNERTREILTKK